jgi:hypothetical protein
MVIQTTSFTDIKEYNSKHQTTTLLYMISLALPSSAILKPAQQRVQEQFTKIKRNFLEVQINLKNLQYFFMEFGEMI